MADYFRVFAAPDSHIEFLSQHPDSVFDYVEGQPPKPRAVTPKQQVKPSKPTFWQRLFGGSPKPPSPAPQPTAPTPELVPPDDWPSEELTEIGPAECIHRNVDLYHLILNGTSKFVEGSGSIFQTWLTNDQHSAVNIIHGEVFAFKSHQIPELLRLVSGVTVELVQSRFTQWLRDTGDKDYTPGLEESEEFAVEFRKFGEALQEAVKQSHGLIWVPG